MNSNTPSFGSLSVLAQAAADAIGQCTAPAVTPPKSLDLSAVRSVGKPIRMANLQPAWAPDQIPARKAIHLTAPEAGLALGLLAWTRQMAEEVTPKLPRQAVGATYASYADVELFPGLMPVPHPTPAEFLDFSALERRIMAGACCEIELFPTASRSMPMPLGASTGRISSGQPAPRPLPYPSTAR